MNEVEVQAELRIKQRVEESLIDEAGRAENRAIVQAGDRGDPEAAPGEG